MEIQPDFVNTATGSAGVRLVLLFPATERFAILFTAGYPKLPQLLISVSALLPHSRLLIKFTIISFLEPPLFDSVGGGAIKITVPFYLLVAHSCVSVVNF